MSRGAKVRAGLTTLAAATAIAALAAVPAGATRTVSIPSSLQISAYGYFGKVKSPNSGCIADRTVVLKQKGHGVLGAVTSPTSRAAGKSAPKACTSRGSFPSRSSPK